MSAFLTATSVSIHSPPMMSEGKTKRPKGRPRKKRPVETRLAKWIMEGWGGDYAGLARELEITEAYLDDLAAGILIPGPQLALRIKEISGEALDLDALIDPKCIKPQ